MGTFGNAVRAAFALAFVTNRKNTAQDALSAGASVAEAIDFLEGLQRGAKFLSGVIGPVSADGLVGDAYVNRATTDFYLKDSTGWQFQFQMKGQDGRSPVKGVDYTDGHSPVKGVDYRDGYDGKSAYELWKLQGNVGTVAQFLASLKGTDGDGFAALNDSEVIPDSVGISGLALREAIIWLANNRTGTVPVVTVPGQVGTVTPTVGDGQVALAWLAPASNGGAAITAYTVRYRPVGASTYSVFGTTANLTLAVTGLTNGQAYQFTVTATNSAGAGAASAVVTSTPIAPVITGRLQVQGDGDSLMAGYLSSDPATKNPIAVMGLALGNTNYGDFRCWAVGGQELTDMLARQATQLATRDTGTYPNGVLIAGGGHNDLFHGYTIDVVIARYQQYVQQAVAAGWKVIVETKSASYYDFYASAGYGPNIDQMAQLVAEFNKRTRALWRTWGASGIVDIAADIHIGVFHPDHTCDFAYYNGDKLHFTDFGYAYKAGLYRPAVVAVGAGNIYGVVTAYAGNPDTGPVTLTTENVAWSQMSNATATGNSLAMTSGAKYHATGHSSKEMGPSSASTRGIYSFELNAADGEFVTGLNSQDTGSDYSDIELAFAVYNGQIRPFGPNTPGNGNNTTGFVNFTDGDIAKVVVNANSVEWKLNSTVLFSILYAPTAALFVDASIANSGNKVRNAVLSAAVLNTRVPAYFFIEDDDSVMASAYTGGWGPNNDHNFRGGVGMVLPANTVGTVTVTLLNVRGFRLWAPGGADQVQYRGAFSYSVNGGAVVNATQAISNPAGGGASWPYYASPLESAPLDMTIVLTFPSSTALALYDGIEGIR